MRAGTMEPEERRVVLEELTSSEARLLQLVEGLTPEQWRFRETPERWSIAENIEHCVVFERFIMGVIVNALEGTAEPEKKTLVGAKEPLAFGVSNSRGLKLKAREALRPVGRWPDTAELVAELRSTRAATLAFAAQTQAELRDHFFPHIAFGDLDCYQWLVVVGQHAARHALQIEEIMTDPGYPVI